MFYISYALFGWLCILGWCNNIQLPRKGLTVRFIHTQTFNSIKQISKTSKLYLHHFMQVFCYTVIKISSIYVISICTKLLFLLYLGLSIKLSCFFSIFSLFHPIWATKAWCIKYDTYKNMLWDPKSIVHLPCWASQSVSPAPQCLWFDHLHPAKQDQEQLTCC